MAEKKAEEFQTAATRVSLVSMITNVILTLLKLAAGLLAHSGAMISDAVHSASDIFSGLIVLLGVKISQGKPVLVYPGLCKKIPFHSAARGSVASAK